MMSSIVVDDKKFHSLLFVLIDLQPLTMDLENVLGEHICSHSIFSFSKSKMSCLLCYRDTQLFAG